MPTAGARAALGANQRTQTTVIATTVHGLDVDNPVGDLRVQPGATTRVVATARWRFNPPVITATDPGGVLTVQVDCPSDLGLNNCSVGLVITVPVATEVHAVVGAGAIDIRGLTGDEHVGTSAGAVTVRNVTGGTIEAGSATGPVVVGPVVADHIAAAASAGRVSVEDRQAPTSMRATSSAADVDVTVPSGRYALTAHTPAGRVRVSGIVEDPKAPRHITATSAAGDVTVRGD